jgi:hypothetical protein
MLSVRAGYPECFVAEGNEQGFLRLGGKTFRGYTIASSGVQASPWRVKNPLRRETSGVHTDRGSTRSQKLAALCKAAWAFFVLLQFAAAGMIFLLMFYVFLSALGNLLGPRLVLKEWRETLSMALGPSAWLLLGFLAARLMSLLSLDLVERFRRVRCPACRAELVQGANPSEVGGALVCPKCGAKI